MGTHPPTPARARGDRAPEAPPHATATETPERALANLERLLARTPPAADADVVAGLERARAAGVGRADPRLVRLLTKRPEVIRVGKAWSGLRKAIRAAQADERPAPMSLAKAGAALDPAWPGFRHTEGKRVAMVGGDLREERRDRLEAEFRLAKLDWVAGTQHRQVQALGERIRRGSIDLVWVLTAYCSHSVSDLVTDAAAAARVRCVNVRYGYGVQNVRQALDTLGADGLNRPVPDRSPGPTSPPTRAARPPRRASGRARCGPHRCGTL